MGVFVLTETSAGYGLFKSTDKKILKKEDFSNVAQSAEQVNELLKLKKFVKFESATQALEEVAALIDGRVTQTLSTLLDTLKDEKKAILAVADPKLGQAINKLPGITLQPISDSTTNEIYRAIRDHLPSLIPGLAEENIATMSLGLSHSLSRHKLKFSPDKVDTMIVQAIALLDDLDKELNIYAMRVKEWYGWHFPEMGKIVNDNLAYARIILKVGMRTNTSNSDLSEILPEEIETAIKAAAEVSMGTEITEEDLDNIQLLAEQVIGFTEYRLQLSSYLTARMLAIAPNLTELVGELVGARLIAHSGSLMNLAKSPASTLQILGAEKALFRALKTKHDTPKYGLIYHASLVGQATGKNKGKIARMLAAKAAIGIRVDALSDWSAQGEGKGDDVDDEERSALGVTSRAKIDRHLRLLEGKPLLPRGVTIAPNGKAAATPGKWEVKEARKYNADADGLAGDEPAAIAPVSEKNSKKEKKDKKEKKVKVEEVKKPLIQEVPEDKDSENTDTEMADVDTGLGLAAPSLNGTKAEPVANKAKVENEDEDISDAISAVSADSADAPASPVEQWQSSIVGNTIEAKKARKKERHERKVAQADEKAKKKAEKKAKEARKADLEERRQKKAAQDVIKDDPTAPVAPSTPALAKVKTEEDPDIRAAEAAGLSLKKYKKKLAKGKILLGSTNGTPASVTVIKKETIAEANTPVSSSKKRKTEDNDVEKSEKKKKKKSKN